MSYLLSNHATFAIINTVCIHKLSIKYQTQTFQTMLSIISLMALGCFFLIFVFTPTLKKDNQRAINNLINLKQRLDLQLVKSKSIMQTGYNENIYSNQPSTNRPTGAQRC